MKYRKKPIVVDAWKYEEGGLTPYWLRDALLRVDAWYERVKVSGEPVDRVTTIVIATPEGDMRANLGDWIIRGIKGELYPCKADIFAATYEPVIEVPCAVERTSSRMCELGTKGCVVRHSEDKPPPTIRAENATDLGGGNYRAELNVGDLAKAEAGPVKVVIPPPPWDGSYQRAKERVMSRGKDDQPKPSTPRDEEPKILRYGEVTVNEHGMVWVQYFHVEGMDLAGLRWRALVWASRAIAEELEMMGRPKSERLASERASDATYSAERARAIRQSHPWRDS